MFVDSSVIDYFTNEMVLAKVNGDKDTVIARQYKVSGFPTAVMLTADGKEVDRIVGYAPPQEYLQMVKDYRNGIGTLDDLLAKAQDSVDRTLYYNIADKYKYRGAPEDAKSWYQKVIDAGQPADSMSGEARFSLADMKRRAKDWDATLADFQSIMTDFQGKPFAESAEIWIAIVHRQKGDTATAITAFEKFLEHYPNSEDAEYAKGQIEKLKNPPKPKEESGS